MDEYLTKIQKWRDVRESSLNLYKSYMTKLNKEFNGDNEFSMDFIKDKIDEIIKWIDENYSNSVKRNFYATLLVFVSPRIKNDPIKGFSNIYNDLQVKLKDSHQIYIDKLSENESYENKGNPISFTVNRDVESGDRLLFRIDYVGNNYADFQYIEIKTTPEYFNISDRNLTATTPYKV